MSPNESLSPSQPLTGDTTDKAAVKATDGSAGSGWGHEWLKNHHEGGGGRAHLLRYADKNDCTNLNLPNCTVGSSQVESLAGKISFRLSVSELSNSAVFALASGANAGDVTRDRSKDKVSQLTVTATDSDKPSSTADFYVNKAGVVTVAHNPDHNKNTALTIEFQANPAASKQPSELTGEEKASLAAQKTALNVLAEYLRDGYANQAQLKVSDDKNMLADYLKSPNLDQNNQVTTAPELGRVVPPPPGAPVPPGIPGVGMLPSIGIGGRGRFHHAGPYPGAGYPSAYAGSYQPPLQNAAYQNGYYNNTANPYYSNEYGVRDLRSPFNGMLGTGPQFYMGAWNQFTPQETVVSSINPFEVTGDSLLAWLMDSGVDLGNPPDPAKLDAALKKLTNENPDLAKTLGSKEFKDMIKEWHDSGHEPSVADLSKALPKNLTDEVSTDLKHRFAAEFKNDKGQVDWGKVAVSEHIGKEATDVDMAKYKDIATAANGPDMSRYQPGQEIPASNRRAIIMQGLQLAGAPVTEQNIDCINQIAFRESHWIPNNVNNWDRNAANGTPSIGIMQTIGSTFQENCVPGHNNIYNPTHNIAAAVRYMARRYGAGNYSAGIYNVAISDSGY